MNYHSRTGFLRAFVGSFAALLLLAHGAQAQDSEEVSDEELEVDVPPEEPSTQGAPEVTDVEATTEAGTVLYATFDVASEPLTIDVSRPSAREKVIALWHGQGTGRIPVGKLVCAPAEHNAPWSFYVDPATVSFANGTIELCDATPSYIDANCAKFGTGTFCPWSAQLVALRECPDATTPLANCPLLP